MAFGGLNHWAVLLAALASFALGAGWYWAFAKPWLAATGLSPVHRSRNSSYVRYVYTIISLWLMAFGLAGVIGHLGIGQVTLRNGIISGVACWLAFVLTVMLVSHGWAQRKPILLAIDGGYWLLSLTLMGAIIGWIGV